MAGGKRQEGRELAEVLSFFSVSVPLADLSYTQYVSLVLNIDRVRRQRSVDVGLGVQSVLSDDILDPTWADAQARDPAEVEELASRNAQERLKARAVRKMGW